MPPSVSRNLTPVKFLCFFPSFLPICSVCLSPCTHSPFSISTGPSLCPLLESHLCPRSASASPLQPANRTSPLRSRSSDRQKNTPASTSASSDSLSTMTQVSLISRRCACAIRIYDHDQFLYPGCCFRRQLPVYLGLGLCILVC